MRMPVTALIIALAVPFSARADDKTASAPTPAPAKRKGGAQLSLCLAPGVTFVGSASGARPPCLEEASPTSTGGAKAAAPAKAAPKSDKAKK